MLSPTATLVVLSFVCIGFVCHADIAKFTVSVVDDITGEPMKDVEVTAGFGVDAGWKAWTESAPIVEDVRHTDQSGLCRLKGETNTGETWARVMASLKRNARKESLASRYGWLQKLDICRRRKYTMAGSG